jgi:polysaccharide pyruvyl transferase WcaK-like protein
MKTIAVFGYYGVGNLGDEAVVATLIRNIRMRVPDVRIVGISLDPADTQARHGIEALPIRRMYMPHTPEYFTNTWSTLSRLFSQYCLKVPAEAAFMFTSLRALRSIDAVIVAGSGGIYDWWHGAWTHPFTHFRWSVLCRLMRTRLVYLSVGAGPFKTPLGKWFFRSALSSASYRSFRDEESLRWMHRIGMHKVTHVCPDMAFGITMGAPPDAVPLRPGKRMRVGINALPYYHAEWSALMEHDGIGYDAYIDVIADFVNLLLKRDCVPVFFHSQVGDEFLDVDIAAAVDMKRRDTRWREVAGFSEAATPEDLLIEISKLDMVVASRFHAVLFSYLLGKPVLGISYHYKIDDLMRRMDQAPYLLDIRALTLERLAEAFTVLEHDVRIGVWSMDNDIVERYRTELRRQFDEVFLHNAAQLI